MVKLKNYFLLSAAATAAVVGHAFHTREQFYPAVIYLATSKLAVATLGNFSLALALVAFQVRPAFLYGSLAPRDSGRGEFFLFPSPFLPFLPRRLAALPFRWPHWLGHCHMRRHSCVSLPEGAFELGADGGCAPPCFLRPRGGQRPAPRFCQGHGAFSYSLSLSSLSFSFPLSS